MRGMARSGIMGRIFGRRKAAPPRSDGPRSVGPAPPPAPVRAEPGGDDQHVALMDAAVGFVRDHEPLLDDASPTVLQRVFTQG